MEGTDVQINIGLMEWNETLMKLKVRRGKKLMLIVSNTAPYHIIKEKAIMKWSAFLCLGQAKSILHKNTSCIIRILLEFHARTLRTPIPNYYF